MLIMYLYLFKTIFYPRAFQKQFIIFNSLPAATCQIALSLKSQHTDQCLLIPSQKLFTAIHNLLRQGRSIFHFLIGLQLQEKSKIRYHSHNPNRPFAGNTSS